MCNKTNVTLATTILVLLLAVSACSTTPPSLSPLPTVSPKAATASPDPASAVQTFGQAATAGKDVFTASCVKCHREDGKRPLTGTTANLGASTTAQELFDYISQTMPPEAQGSLSRQDYLDVLSFILIQNNYISEATTFDPNQLQDIRLRK